MRRESEGRRTTGERTRTDAARRYRSGEDILYDGDRQQRPPDAAGRVDGDGRADVIEPNRVDVERRTGTDRRVADHPVDQERRMADRRAIEQQERAEARERRSYAVTRVTQAVDYLFYLLYGLLATRFVLSLLGASETAGFVQFIQGVTNPFYAPFANIVARPAVNGGFLDFPLLIAVLGYALLHMAIRGLLRLVAGRPAVP